MPKLKIEELDDATVIEGVTYSNSLFRFFATDGVSRGPFVIDKLSDIVIIMDASKHCYTILRRFTSPARLHDRLRAAGLAGPWFDILKDQTIAEKVDMLCDDAFQLKKQTECDMRKLLGARKTS